MARLENESSPYNASPFQKEIIYSNPYMKPRAIAEGTSQILTMYFDNTLPDFDAGREYLTDYTLAYIDNVRAGFAKHPERIDRIGIASLEDLILARQHDRQSTLPEDETLEALDYSLITMGIMPDMVAQPYIDIEGNSHILKLFSRRGMLQPPQTLEQTRGRFHEMWVEIVKIANKTTSPKINFYNNPQVLRTSMFFEVGKNIPLRS
jgi:hypothetical protein